MDAVKRKRVLELKKGGVSHGDVKALSGEEDTKGLSRANVGRTFTADTEQALLELNERRFEAEGIVAAYIDGTAIGVRRKKRLVMVVVGITADGRKIPLGIRMAPGEKTKDILKLLEDVVWRGVDPRILWITDKGGGIRAALEELCKSKSVPLEHLEHQICTSHVARFVVKRLPKEMRDDVSKQLRRAWDTDDEAAARKDLTVIADRLEKDGHTASAGSLRRAIEGTLTVQRLGLKGALREQLASTNAEESINSGIKNHSTMKNLTRWTDSRRLHYVAWQLRRIAGGWTRLADPAQLVDLKERFPSPGPTAEEIRADLPPSITATRLSAPLDHDEWMRELATRWLDEHPGAAPIGLSHVLATLGLAGKQLTPETLVDAMRSRDPGTGEILRAVSKVPVETLDADGNLTVEHAQGIVNLAWELTAPPAARREWDKGGADREKVEGEMMRAASAALERLTGTPRGNHGFAGVAALRRPSAEDPKSPLQVSGIVFLVRRGMDGKYRAPVPKRDQHRFARLRGAEDAAKAILVEPTKEVAVPAAAVAPQPPVYSAGEPRPLAPRLPTPELLAALKVRALDLAPRMVGLGREELQARAAGLTKLEEDLSAIAPEVQQWKEQHGQAAIHQIAAWEIRSRDYSSDRSQSIWGPLTRGQRAVLGELGARKLLGTAASVAGSAAVDAATAGKLRGVNENALAGLDTPVARVQAVAEALAAARELARRRQFEAAREGDGSKVPDPPMLRDSRGVIVADPISRYRAVLGAERAAALRRSWLAIAPEVKEMDDAALRRLADTTKEAWTRIGKGPRPTLAGLERDRDVALGKGLAAQWDRGRAEGKRKQAGAGRPGVAFVDTDKEVEVFTKRALGHWQALRALDGKMAERRRAAGSPATLIEDPNAVIHQAAYAELLRRERERERILARETERTPEPLEMDL